MDFEGKVAIITGGANGTGKAIALALLNIGMKVCICDINESAAKLFFEELSDDLKNNVIYMMCNVSSVDELRAVFEKTQKTFGKIDVVFNNAGILNEHDWKKMINVNFIGVINGIHLALEFMGINNGGSGGFIINTASLAGVRAFPLAPVYSGCKHAIIGLTRSYGVPYHFEKTGVTVNAICPGRTDTELFHTFPSFVLDEELAKKHRSKSTPISPAEVAKAALQLLQDGKNGSLLCVDADGIRYVE